MTCAKCGGQHFFLDAEDGLKCWACRKPYSPILAIEAPGPRDYTPEQKETALARAGAVGMYRAAQEMGMPYGTLHRWIVGRR